MKEKLISWREANELKIDKIWDYYRKYVNAGQVNLIASFGFGRDVVNHAEGCWIFTKSGRKILDFTGGVGVLNHGHNNPRILETRIDYQKNKYMEIHKNYFSPYVAVLAHNLAKILPGDLNISYFPNSGAEAVEGAIKMAYKYHSGSRKSILYSDISFHGKLLGAASVTGSPELHFKFPQIPNTYSFEYNNINTVKELVYRLRKENKSSDVYAIIVEPFNASSLRCCSGEFLRTLRDICSEEDIILIFDEIYSGWAKTGELFYFINFNIIPDILTMSKSFGGGKASISCYTCRDHVFKNAYGNLNDATLHSTTFNGFGEETITAIEAINIIIEDDYVSKSKHIYNRLNTGLQKLQNKYPKTIDDVRGSGALNGIIIRAESKLISTISKIIPSDLFRDPRFLPKLVTAAIICELYDEHGILTFYGSNVEIPLIISPSLIVTDEEIDYFLNALDKTLEKGLLKLSLKFARSKFFKK